jgi:hypothetical protein
MLGRIVLVTVKKWWLVALVFTLALSLTSCSKRRSEYIQPDIGVGYCDDESVGQTDIYVKRSDAQPDLFEIYAVPAYMVEEGFIAQFNVFNANPAYKPLLPEVVMYSGQPIFLGYLNTDELESYTEMAISPADPSTTFLEQETDQFVRCPLPLPGDGVDYEGQVIGARTTRSGKKVSITQLRPRR